VGMRTKNCRQNSERQPDQEPNPFNDITELIEKETLQNINLNMMEKLAGIKQSSGAEIKNSSRIHIEGIRQTSNR